MIVPKIPQWYKKSLSFLLAAILLTGCGGNNSSSQPESGADSSDISTASESTDTDKTDEENIYIPSPEEEPPTAESDYKQARLRSNTSEEYRDIDLIPDNQVDVPNRTGYTFLGYWDTADGTGRQYIDETGKILRDDSPEELVVLYPAYDANEYSVILCEDGGPLNNFNRILCKYDQDIVKDLPLGRELPSSDDPQRVIIGFKNAAGTLLIGPSRNEKTLKNLASEEGGAEIFDHENRTVYLDIATSDLSYTSHNYDTRTITADNYTEQSLDSDNTVYDRIEMPDTIDLAALKTLGYESAQFSVEYVISSENKEAAHIRIIADSKASEKDSVVKDDSVVKIDVDDDDFKDETSPNTGKQTHDIDLNELEEIMRIYYKSKGILFWKKEWTLTSIDIKVTIQKPS